MNLYFFAWGASLFFGIEGIVAKIIAKHYVKNIWLFNFFWMFFVLVFTIPIALWYGAGVPAYWKFILLSSIFYALASLLNLFSLSRLDISVLVPLFSFRTALTAGLGALFLGEILSGQQYFLLGLIFIFGIFVSLDENFSFRSFFNKNIFVLILCIICYILSAMFLKKAVALNGFWTTTLWIPFLCQLWLLGTIPLIKEDIFRTSAKQFSFIAFAALLGLIGVLFSNKAYSINVTLATAITSIPLSMIIVFLASRFFPELLETHTLKVYAVRFISAAVMIIAALNL